VAESSTVVETIEGTRAVRVVAGDLGQKASLVEPNDNGSLLLAAETDGRPVWLPNARAKNTLLEAARRAAAELRTDADVTDVAVFDAIFAPPGRGEFLNRRPGEVHVARFDLVVLLKAVSRDAATRVRASNVWRSLNDRIREASRHTIELAATNARRMGDVDHTRDGVFLFNFFFADDVDQNIAVWEHTAGWWQKETDLDNSEVMLPEPGASEYTIINHCRWDRLADFLPDLLFKRGFRAHVEGTFNANDVAPIPILYRRV
jgi:hypothetical protein